MANYNILGSIEFEHTFTVGKNQDCYGKADQILQNISYAQSAELHIDDGNGNKRIIKIRINAVESYDMGECA